MKLAVYHIPDHHREALRDLEPSLDALHIQFGDEILLDIASATWGDAVRTGLEVREYPGSIKREHLHLVIQIGNLFQRAHPEVPVILNKGRYLAVELEPDQTRYLATEDTKCYTVRPLQATQVVFDVRVPTAAHAAPVPQIETLVQRVSRTHVEANMQHLASYSTRFSTSEHYANAAAWAREQLQAMEYETRLEQIAVGSGQSFNVIAEKSGRGPGPRHLILVVAHLDSINLVGGPSASAPGADDNGSGSAGLLEIARVLAAQPVVHDLRLILFGGEEQGLFGSQQYVARLTAAERARIRAVINMDMIATLNTATPTVLLEGASISQTLIDALADAAARYTHLTVQTSLQPFNSDHVPFIDAALPAVLTIEGTDSANHNVHTASDTLQYINYDLMLDILRMNVACTAHLLKQSGEHI